jgi:hypothetical protein
MLRVPFAFSLTGGSTKYGTPFVKTDAAFTNALKNLVLSGIDGATQTPDVYGITLPPTGAAYKIVKVHVESDDADDDVQLGIHNGSAAVAPFARIVNGTGEFDFGQGLVVPSGYKPFLEYLAASGGGVITGWIDWEKVG